MGCMPQENECIAGLLHCSLYLLFPFLTRTPTPAEKSLRTVGMEKGFVTLQVNATQEVATVTHCVVRLAVDWSTPINSAQISWNEPLA